VAVAAQHDHAGTDQSDLGRDDVLDALHRIVDVEQMNAMLRTIAREVGGLFRGVDDLDRARANRHRPRGNHVIDDTHLLMRTSHAQAFLTQSRERLGAGVLVHDVQIGVEEDVLCVDDRYGMRIDQFPVKRL
jgi:hypothetical protein